MIKLLEPYSSSKLSQEETDNLNILITRNEIEFAIKKRFHAYKSRTKWVHWEILSNIQRRIYTILLKLFQNIEEVGIFQSHSRKSHHPNIPKPTKTLFNNENYMLVSLIKSSKILTRQIQSHFRKDHTPWSSWIHSRITKMFQHIQSQCERPLHMLSKRDSSQT